LEIIAPFTWSVKAGPVAGMSKDTGQSGSGGSFAVGAGNQDGSEFPLGIAQRSHERAHVRQFEFSARRAGCGVQFLTERVQAVKGRGIGHDLILE
jgi:hypothetical protein